MTKRPAGAFRIERRNVALITWSGLPEGAESEQLLLPHLAAAGVEAEIVDWARRLRFRAI